MLASIPALFSNRPFSSLERRPLVGVDGRVLGDMTLTPYVRTHALLDQASERLLALQRTPARELFHAFRAAAALLRGDDWRFCSLAKADVFDLVAASTGLPRAAIPAEFEAVASLLDQLEEIVLAQIPTVEPNPLDTHRYPSRGTTVGYYPTGHSLLVKLPGNMPTICYYWLVPLALKRPLWLVPSPEDPYTHLVVLEALRAVAPWLSACVQYLPCDQGVWERLIDDVDQVVVPQSAVDRRSNRWLHRAHIIHYGQSKLVIPGDWGDDAVELALRRMLWNFGRTCTGLSSVLLTTRGRDFADALAARVHAEFGAGERRDRLAACPVERGRQIDALIASLLRRGAVEDVLYERFGRDRLVVADGRATLLPTVLWVGDRNSRALGLELPFPFVSVAEVPESGLLEHARDTLILSVLGGEPGFLDRLCYERSIHKVFGDAHAERGFVAVDPHEGYMVDFLYHRKAVLA